MSDVKHTEERTETHECVPKRAETHGDAVSREDAIEAVRNLQTYKLDERDDMLLVDLADVQTELMMMPSAEPKWIPVSEGLPEKDDRYLITTFGIFKREYVEMAGFSTASKTWTQYDLEYGYVPVDDVIAWMPMPEPYRKGEQE